MKSSYDVLGNYIRLIDIRNSENTSDKVLGISIDKYFMPSVANIIGTDLSKYKLISKGCFACNPMHVGRDERLPVALYSDDIPALVSPAYFMFEIIDNAKLNADYLMMWFRRPEFDRNCWLKTDGSVRGGITWEDFCRIEILVPTLEEQESIVKKFQTISHRIKIKRQMNDNLAKYTLLLYKRLCSQIGECNMITGTISELGEFVRGKNITSAEMREGNIPVISAGIEPSGTHNSYNVLAPSITISGSGVNAGYVSFHSENIWASDCSFNNTSKFIRCLYVILQINQPRITEMQKGTAQPHVYPKEVNPFEIKYPPFKEMEQLENQLIPLFDFMSHNLNEIKKLKITQQSIIQTISSR